MLPTETPEADGTLHWTETTLVVVEAGGAGKTGFGDTYASSAAAALIEGDLARHVLGGDASASRQLGCHGARGSK